MMIMIMDKDKEMCAFSLLLFFCLVHGANERVLVRERKHTFRGHLVHVESIQARFQCSMSDWRGVSLCSMVVGVLHHGDGLRVLSRVKKNKL